MLSLRNRSKHKPNGNHNERKKQKIAQKSSEGVMDDESFSSIMVKKKKISPESEEEGLMADTTRRTLMKITSNSGIFRFQKGMRWMPQILKQQI